MKTHWLEIGLVLGMISSWACKPVSSTSDSSCTDVDGDGYGVGCPAGADCDDTDATIWTGCGGCIDNDGDGYGDGCAAGADCDDTNTSIWTGCGGDCKEIWADSPSSADIQEAIDLSADCDTVRVPEGDATWTSNVTVPPTKGVQLIAAGMDSTRIDLANTYTIFLDTRPTNSRVRLSGFGFSNCPAPSLRINDQTIGATDWRVDHCSWTNGVLGTQINIEGHTFGVIDNCTFTNCLRTFWIDGQVRPFDTTGSPVPYPGGYSWTQPVTLGGPDAVYIEDCTIHNDTSSIFFNMRGGARAVIRHNTVTGVNGLETHSGCTPGYRNPRWIEIYENTFSIGAGTYWCGLFLRSTNGIVFNNTFSSGYGTPITFDNETTCLDTCIGPWPTANKTVYPAQDQIGAGRDTGYGTAQATDEAKLWIWNNTLAGGPTSPKFNSCAGSADLVQLGRDYFLSEPAGYTPYTYPHPLRGE